MNFLLAEMNKIVSLNQLDSLNGNLDGVPFFMFIKDKKGKYLHANQPKLQFFGFEKESDILGLTDFDLCMTHHQATIIRENDIKIMNMQKSHSFLEEAQNDNNQLIRALSYKSPLTLRSKKIVGMVGLAFLSSPAEQLKQELGVNKNHLLLSKRQTECLHFLAYGMTIKEIAKELNLSPRTIEHYIEMTKVKLGCHSRSELIKLYRQCN